MRRKEKIESVVNSYMFSLLRGVITHREFYDNLPEFSSLIASRQRRIFVHAWSPKGVIFARIRLFEFRTKIRCDV